MQAAPLSQGLTPLGWADAGYAGPPGGPVPDAWYRPEALTGGAHAPLACWPDASGHGRHLVQPDPELQPYQAVGYAGIAGVRYGHGTYLQGTWGLAAPYTIILVGRWIAYPYQAGTAVLLDGAVGAAPVVLDGTLGTLAQGSANPVSLSVVGGPYIPALLHIHEWTWAGGAGGVWLNSLAHGADATGSPTPGGLTLGAARDGSAGAQCEIFEVLVYSRPLTGAERAALYTYLQDKYHLPAAVPPVAGIVGWWHADLLAGSLLEGDPVATWPSAIPAAGGAHDLAQADATHRPHYQPFWNFSGVRFTDPVLSSPGHWLGATFPLAQPCTILLAVARLTLSLAEDVHRTGIDGAVSDSIHLYWLGNDDLLTGTARLHLGPGPDLDSVPISGLRALIRAELDGPRSRLAYNADPWSAPADAGSIAPGGLTVGARADGSQAMGLEVYELWLLDHAAVSAADRALIESYLQAKIGLY